MKLTGKAKEDFWKWANDNNVAGDTDVLWQWDNLPESMQWGVYVDFFDSVGIEISTSIGFWDVTSTGESFLNEECEIRTRPEARKAAIEKANEIYNSK